MKLHIEGSTGNSAKKITTYAHFSTTELVFKYFWRQVYVPVDILHPGSISLYCTTINEAKKNELCTRMHSAHSIFAKGQLAE